MIKKLFIYFLFISLNVCSITHGFSLTKPLTPEQLKIEEERTSAGHLMPENETFIRSIMQQMNISQSIQIRKPLPAIIEVAPVYNFEFYVAQSNFWYVNEAWFNTLTQEEKTFVIASRLYNIKHDIKHTVTQYIPTITAFIIELPISYFLYNYIRSYGKIGSFNNSRTKSVVTTLLAMAILDTAMGPLWRRWETNNLNYLCTSKDLEIVKELNCLDGAISLLKKMQETVKILATHDATYWKTYTDTFPVRITTLEQFKEAQS